LEKILMLGLDLLGKIMSFIANLLSSPFSR